ncbi:MAG: hypothetical protein AB1481_07475 [Candidatus Omnitrophota bacterium]
MLYLFIGEDRPAKDLQIKRLKEQFLAKGLEQFNLDTLYAKDLSLKELQEKFLCLPVKADKRVIIIKSAQNLKEESREFLIAYAKKPARSVIAVLDFDRYERRDNFVRAISAYAKIIRFKDAPQVNTFSLEREISLGRKEWALRILSELLKNGERPERILGGLRYAWENSVRETQGTQRKFRLLLNCDLEIKTGKLKPVFALEKLVLDLCRPVKPLR